MLFNIPNELVYSIFSFCDESSMKNIKLTSKMGYLLVKDFEMKKLIKLNSTNSNIIYKMCIKHCLYPYSFDISNSDKIERLLLELKLKFFLTNRSVDSLTKIFSIFYISLLK